MSWKRKEFLRAIGVWSLGLAARPVRAGEEAATFRAVLPHCDEHDPEPFWTAVRAAYHFPPGLTYLNTGGLGPVAIPILEATAALEQELHKRVETGHDRRSAARATLARFLDVQREELAFVRNATEGNGIIAAGLDLRLGDEVIFESHAHPGGSFPWLNQAQRRGLVVKTFDPDPTDASGNVTRVAALLTERTRVVQVSHVTAPTGLRMPVEALAELCRSRGVWLHLDGAQSAGMLPLRVRALGCDSYSTSGHKWLGGPRETGLLFVRAERLEQITPTIAGAYSGEAAEPSGPLVLARTGERFEYGTRDNAAVAGLALAAEWQERVGRERIARRGRGLVERLRTGLQTIPDVEILTPDQPDYASAMLTFRSSRLPYDRLFHRLFHDHGLRCRPVSELHLDAIRVSCHLFNTPVEIDRLLAAVDGVLRAA